MSWVLATATVAVVLPAGMVTVVVTPVKSVPESAPLTPLPLLVVKVTVVSVLLRLDWLTTKLSVPPSVAVALVMLSVGTGSSFKMLPVAVAVPKVAPVAALKLAVKVSVPS